MSDESREPETVPCCDRCYLRSGESIAMTWDPEAEEFECNRHVTPADLRANKCECGNAYLGTSTVRVLDMSSTVHTREGCGDSLEEWQATISSLREENVALRGLRESVAQVLIESLHDICPWCGNEPSWHDEDCAIEVLTEAWDKCAAALGGSNDA